MLLLLIFFSYRLHTINYCHPTASLCCENLATGEGLKGKHGAEYKPYGCLWLTFESTHSRECISAIVSVGLPACLSRIHMIMIMLVVIVGP